MVNGGIFTTRLMGYLLSYGQMWRLVLALGGAIGALGGIGLLFSAESQNGLLSKEDEPSEKDFGQNTRKSSMSRSEFASWGISQQRGCRRRGRNIAQ